jgi:hypothetical protein
MSRDSSVDIVMGYELDVRAKIFLSTRTVSIKITRTPVTTAWRVLGLRMEERPPAANILNKQLRIKDKGWSSSLRFGLGANDASP